MLTLLLAVVSVALATTLVLVFVGQQRLAGRLLAAGHRLSDEIVPSGSGLAEATSVVERAVDRSVLWGGEGSIVEARLARALDVIPQGVVVFDDTGTITYRNSVASSYLTARHGDALVEEAIAELAEVATGTKDGLPPRTVDLFGPPRRTLVLTAVSLQQEGRRLGVLVVIDDITDRRRLEGVRRDFVANISHELKTPVGALALLAETLVSEYDRAVALRLALRILAAAFRFGRTIDDLL
jgi:signal transduction histidine kinase